MAGGGGTQTTTQQVNTDMGPWKPQQSFLTDVFGSAKGLYDSGAGTGYYPGKTVAGFTPGQTQGYQQIIDQGLKGSPLMPAANKTALDTINGSYLDPNTNPWIKKSFEAGADSVGNAYKTITAPQTDATMAMAGRYGSGSYANMRGNDERALGTTLNNLETSTYGANYAQERQNQLNQTNNVGSLIQAGYLDPTAAVNAGGAVQGQNQKEIDAEIAKFNFTRDAPWMNLARYKSMVDGSYGQSGTQNTTSQQPMPQGNSAGMALGGILGAGSVAGQLGWSPFGAGAAAGAMSPATMFGPAMALSDARAKDDIKSVGKTHDGQNLYSFRYKGDPTPHVGLMAQEVERTKPEAVVTHPSGYKMVNYDLALMPSILMPRVA